MPSGISCSPPVRIKQTLRGDRRCVPVFLCGLSRLSSSILSQKVLSGASANCGRRAVKERRAARFSEVEEAASGSRDVSAIPAVRSPSIIHADPPLRFQATYIIVFKTPVRFTRAITSSSLSKWDQTEREEEPWPPGLHAPRFRLSSPLPTDIEPTSSISPEDRSLQITRKIQGRQIFLVL